MRTVRRQTEAINVAKQASLKKLCWAYAREKRDWLETLRAHVYQSKLNAPRQIRDEAIKNKYRSRHGLQARHWKLALQDAVETWDKYWEALFVQVRQRVFSHFKLEEERHYAFWLLAGYMQFTACMQGETPVPSFSVDALRAQKIAAYIQRTVRKLKGKVPTVKKSRSIKFDASCYEVFEEKGRQYIKLMSLEKGKRLILPLLGRAKIEGNVTLLLKEDHAEIHVSQELNAEILDEQDATLVAVDFGYTEVMTDTANNRYGKDLGKILTKATDDLHEKMIKRHKLHALEKKRRLSHPKVAKRMRKRNLGKVKQNNKQEKTEASISKEINTAIHQVVRAKKPLRLITEDLSSTFTFNKSRKFNRRLSAWTRGEIQDRVAFKALAEGFCHEQVNPAYGSQTCPHCGFVDFKNRRGDLFKCGHCKHEDVADRVAALNYEKRYEDPQIHRYTPYREVKAILLERFHRRLETEQSVTVPGRTLDTIAQMNSPSASRHRHSRERKSSPTEWSLRERNK